MTLQIIKRPLPNSIHGAAAKEGDGYTVLINDQDDQDRQTLAFLHEMLHIWHKDHDREGADVSALEAERREELKRLLEMCQ